MMPFILALALSQAPDAGVTGLDPHEPLYSSCPDALPTEVITPVNAPLLGQMLLDGALNGHRLSTPERAARLACFIESCDADRKSKAKLLEAPTGPGWWSLIAGTFAAGLLLGGLTGWGLDLLQPKK